MKLHFEKTGAQGKPPLMILHGFLGSLDNWKSYAKRFAKFYEIYLVDLRNHGKSPHSNEFNYPVMTKDLEALIISERLEKITLLGHSMGGKLAIALTKNQPELVEHLIVIDISPREYKDVQSAKIITAINEIDLKKFSSRFQLKEVLEQKIASKSMINFLLKSIQIEENGQLKWKFNLPSFNENLRFLGEGIDLPIPLETKTLFIKGENSNYIKEEDLNYIKEKFKQQETVVIPDCGHWVHHEKGELLFEAIKKSIKLPG